MARTVNREVHQLRRDAFLDVAQQLIVTKGYAQMTIQDVLDQLETSRGALYHYFDSKQALLDGVVDRFAEQGLATIAPVLDDQSLPALRKLEQALAGIALFKAEQRELVLRILEVWNSDGNALLREKLRRLSVQWIQPVFAAIIEQGVAEGTFSVDSADDTARVLVFLLLGYQNLATEQFLARHAGLISFEEVMRSYRAIGTAFERLLGVPPGSVVLLDEATLRFWFE